MQNTPKRRGRPPVQPKATPIAAPEAPEATSEAEAPAPVAKAKRRTRASTGGYRLKLHAPNHPGFIRRWFNDTPGRLAEAEDLAYTHVTDPGVKSDSPDSRVRRLVGTKEGGQPLYAYLMETPIEEYHRGQEEKEEIHRAVDQAISEGRDRDGRVRDAYGKGSIKAG